MIDRRNFIKAGAAATLAVPFATLALAKVEPGVFELRAQKASISLAGVKYGASNLWLYNESSPGPEIRVKQGKTVRVRFTNDLERIAPGRAQYTHLLDPSDASVLDDIIVWWIDDDRFDVMPNASNTSRVEKALADGPTAPDIADVTATRAILAIRERATLDPSVADRTLNDFGAFADLLEETQHGSIPHIGANGASNAPINAVSIGGNNRAPNENNANPTAEFTNPKPAIKTMSCPLANNGPANGKATAALNSADIQAAGMIGIARSIRLMIIIIAKTNVIPNANR